MKRLIILLLIVGCDEPTKSKNKDCDGVADGTAVEDCAGVCGGDTTQEVCDACSSLVFDCDGVCDGSAVVGGCDNTCGSTLVVDECGVCGGSGKQTTYVEECGIENVCGYITTTTQLGSNSYCANGCSNMNGQYCSSNPDCYYSGGFANLGCNTGHQCITTTQETEYVCENQMVCENIPVTSCP